ncbi:MAG: cupin domain-containing protein [Clostridia bacterium]|nr:cupin domain-containing protein [Clostridia bacterium]
MDLIKILTPDFTYPDDRGLLVQICREGYSQINAVFTKKGAVRGNFHFHKNTKEAFFVLSGKILVTAEKDGETETRLFETGDMFLIEEYVRHSFDYLEDTYLVGLYTSPVENEDGTKDIHTD